MRTSIEVVQKVLGCEPPRSIWQKVLDYDASHLFRLLQFVPYVSGVDPSPNDLIDYSNDIHYYEIQPDLFRCLFPLCLQAWRYALLTPDAKRSYGAFVENFLGALASRPFLEELLSGEEYEAVVTFMQDTILDRLDQEECCSLSGWAESEHIYKWFHGLSAFAIIFPALERLWGEWWAIKTVGYATAALKYMSCLMYVEDENPFFRPWTPEHGAGPPELWETGAFIYGRSWRPENVSFLESTLTVDYVEGKLKQAVALLQGLIESDIPEKMLHDFDVQRDILAYRLDVFPHILSSTRPHDPQNLVMWGWLYHNFPGL